MSGLLNLIQFARRRSEGALATWQRLRAQCDEAGRKLVQLKQHGEDYRVLMRAGLQQGMSASATMGYIGFIGQIEAVVFRQQSEVDTLEEACAQQWRELLDARRESRMYEILSERIAAREAAAAARRGQTEIDDLLQRGAKTP